MKNKKRSPTAFIFNRHKIGPVILSTAKKRKQIIYGSRAMNKQLPGILQRGTIDWDVLARKPKASARLVERQLDKKVAGGRDDFFMRPARHPGTYKVMHEGYDQKHNTRDDIEVADYSKMQKVPTVRIKGIRYQSLSSIRKGKKKTLKDPESKYRHRKDRQDLHAIQSKRFLR